jgi:hypothetical protein
LFSRNHDCRRQLTCATRESTAPYQAEVYKESEISQISVSVVQFDSSRRRRRAEMHTPAAAEPQRLRTLANLQRAMRTQSNHACCNTAPSTTIASELQRQEAQSKCDASHGCDEPTSSMRMIELSDVHTTIRREGECIGNRRCHPLQPRMCMSHSTLTPLKTSHPPTALKFNQNSQTTQPLPAHDSATAIDWPRPSRFTLRRASASPTHTAHRQTAPRRQPLTQREAKLM